MFPLPKKVQRTESEIDGLVAAKLVKKHPHRNWALEVKMKKGKLLEHQVKALAQVENGTFPPLKLADTGRRNPFDYIYLGDADAIVCYVEGKHAECTVNGGVMKYSFTI